MQKQILKTAILLGSLVGLAGCGGAIKSQPANIKQIKRVHLENKGAGDVEAKNKVDDPRNDINGPIQGNPARVIPEEPKPGTVVPQNWQFGASQSGCLVKADLRKVGDGRFGSLEIFAWKAGQGGLPSATNFVRFYITPDKPTIPKGEAELLVYNQGGNTGVTGEITRLPGGTYFKRSSSDWIPHQAGSHGNKEVSEAIPSAINRFKELEGLAIVGNPYTVEINGQPQAKKRLRNHLLKADGYPEKPNSKAINTKVFLDGEKFRAKIDQLANCYPKRSPGGLYREKAQEEYSKNRDRVTPSEFQELLREATSNKNEIKRESE